MAHVSQRKRGKKKLLIRILTICSGSRESDFLYASVLRGKLIAMDRLLNVIQKLMLTGNALFWGFCIFGLLLVARDIGPLPNSDYATANADEWWYPVVTFFSNSPESGLLILLAVACGIIGYLVHQVINWIFE